MAIGISAQRFIHESVESLISSHCGTIVDMIGGVFFRDWQESISADAIATAQAWVLREDDKLKNGTVDV